MCFYYNKQQGDTMKYPLIIGYILISIAAIYFFAKPSFKLVSKCCEGTYREVPRRDGYEPYCLECKKWCELKEIKEIQWVILT